METEDPAALGEQEDRSGSGAWVEVAIEVVGLGDDGGLGSDGRSSAGRRRAVPGQLSGGHGDGPRSQRCLISIATISLAVRTIGTKQGRLCWAGGIAYASRDAQGEHGSWGG